MTEADNEKEKRAKEEVKEKLMRVNESEGVRAGTTDRQIDG